MSMLCTVWYNVLTLEVFIIYSLFSIYPEVELESKSGFCIACGRPTNGYTEEAIAVAIVALGTCCHRLPHTVCGYLVSRIIPAVARYCCFYKAACSVYNLSSILYATYYTCTLVLSYFTVHSIL